MIWREEGDSARIERTLSEDLPREMDYLERELPAFGFLFGGDIGLADISIASFFRTAAYAGLEIDAARWPRTAGFVARTLAHDCLARYQPFELAQIRTNPQGRSQALLAAGAPLCPETVGTREPRRGVMPL